METLLGSRFKNDNGHEYEVIQVLDFNDKDKEYYKNSWQKYRVALLQVPYQNEFIVASYLGEHSWGYGYYSDDLEDAVKYYNKIVKDYEY